MAAILSPLNQSVIEGRVQQVMQLSGVENPATAFIYAMIDKIYPNNSLDYSEIITDGTNDRGVDAIYIREREGCAYVDIMNFKYRSSSKTCEKNFEETELSKLFAFITELYNKSDELLKNTNNSLRNRILDIFSIVESGRICYFKIILCSNGRALTPEALERLEHFCKTQHNLDYEQIDHFGTLNLLLQNDRPHELVRLQVVDTQIFDRADGDIRGVVACLEVNSFLDAIIDTNTRSVKRYLFEDNIRVYLGDEGGHNKEIIASSLSPENHLFWYCNNGITIVCDSFEYQKGMRNPILTVVNFQIVNGAQTCHALLRARDQDPVRVSSVLIMCRIYATKRRDVSQKVAIATNSQARINMRDLHANDPLQQKIEAFFFDSGYFYERKKNQHIDKAANKRIDALKLGQILLAYKLREPERAKKESYEIFGSRYNFVFNEELTRDSVIKLVDLYQYIESTREIKIIQEDGIIEPSRAADIMSYGFWHVLFVVSILSERNGIIIPEKYDYDNYIREAVNIIYKETSKYKTVSNYDMFRSTRLRDKLLEEFDGVQLKFKFEID
jgi:hypothetical protein